MRAFWKRKSEFSELEGELRARRSEPSSQLVRALTRRAGDERSWVRPGLRVALVAGLLVVLAAAIGSAGGVSAATSGTRDIVRSIADITRTSTSSSSSSVTTSSVVSAASDQYKEKCGSPPKKKCRLSVNNANVKEGNTGTTVLVFKVTMDNTSSETITVDYSTSGGTATPGTCGTPGVDYEPQSGTLTFVGGTTQQTISITVCGDNTKEPGETFNVTLSNPTPVTAAEIDDGLGVGMIQNDDK